MDSPSGSPTTGSAPAPLAGDGSEGESPTKQGDLSARTATGSEEMQILGEELFDTQGSSHSEAVSREEQERESRQQRQRALSIKLEQRRQQLVSAGSTDDETNEPVALREESHTPAEPRLKVAEDDYLATPQQVVDDKAMYDYNFWYLPDHKLRSAREVIASRPVGSTNKIAAPKAKEAVGGRTAFAQAAVRTPSSRKLGELRDLVRPQKKVPGLTVARTPLAFVDPTGGAAARGGGLYSPSMSRRGGKSPVASQRTGDNGYEQLMQWMDLSDSQLPAGQIRDTMQALFHATGASAGQVNPSDIPNDYDELFEAPKPESESKYAYLSDDEDAAYVVFSPSSASVRNAGNRRSAARFAAPLVMPISAAPAVKPEHVSPAAEQKSTPTSPWYSNRESKKTSRAVKPTASSNHAIPRSISSTRVQPSSTHKTSTTAKASQVDNVVRPLSQQAAKPNVRFRRMSLPDELARLQLSGSVSTATASPRAPSARSQTSGRRSSLPDPTALGDMQQLSTTKYVKNRRVSLEGLL